MQLTSFKALQVLEALVTWATQANKQAGGVATAWLDKRAKDKTVETTVEARIVGIYLLVCVYLYYIQI